MTFLPLSSPAGDDALRADLAAARPIGKASVGNGFLFFRKGLKTAYIPYSDVARCFRRVREMDAKMCCGRGTMQFHSLVLCNAAGKELAELDLDDERQAEAALSELGKRAPSVLIGKK